MSGEFEAIERLSRRLRPPVDTPVWIGDDAAAVVPGRGLLLLAADAVVDGVHADLALIGLDDLGWKALAANVSDVAAMGGVAGHALVTVAGPPEVDLDRLYQGISEAADTYACPVVGGDLVSAPRLVVTVAVTGWVDDPPVRRAGARPGDRVWVTGPLGASAAGLRLLRAGAPRRGDPDPETAACIEAHARPQVAVAEGPAARRAGATAMIDVSDGFGADLGHLADASGIGFELAGVPVAPGASLGEALGGGEDYRLVFTAPPEAPVAAAFAGLFPPVEIGECVADPGRRVLGDRPLDPLGWQHDWDG